MTQDSEAPALTDVSGVCRDLIQHAADAILLVADDGTVRGANRAAHALFGYTGGLVGLSVYDLLENPDEDPFSGLLAAPGENVSVLGNTRDVACRRSDGRTVFVESATSRVEVSGEQVHMAILRDVTSRRELEEVFLETEERLGSIANNIPGIVFQRLMHPDGSFAYPFLSPATEAILGYTPEDLPFNKAGDIDVVHWADRDARREAMQRSAANLTPCHEEFRAITRDSQIRWLSGSAGPQLLNNGDILWDGVLIDITDRKRAEQRVEMVMDHAADAILTINAEGRIESANPAAGEMFGYAEADLVGMDVAGLMPETASLTRAEDIHVQAAGTDTGLVGQGPRETEGRRRDGTTFPLELAVSEVRTETGRVFVGVGRDITVRKLTEEALRESEQRLSSIAANLPGIVFQRVRRPDGTVAYPYVSEGCREVLGVEPEELVAAPELFLEALHPEDRAQFEAHLGRSAETLEPFEEELRVTHRDGRQRWLRGQSRPRRQPDGTVVWDGITLDVTDRKEAEERLRYLAYYDPVTGIPNRSLVVERFEQAQAHADRAGTRVAVLSLGLDGFSIINATFGHATGDQVLKAAAETMQSALGRPDILARASGDRFLMMVTGIVEDADISEVIEAVRGCFRQPVRVEQQEFDLSVTIGVAVYPEHGTDAELLIKNADAAQHRAKGQGVGAAQFFTNEMAERAAKTLSLQARLRRAIDNDEFVPFFHPQISLETGEIIGTEALARWENPELGMVSPGDFIPVAEEYGLIDGIADQILRKSCHYTRQWQQRGYGFIPVAVNISGRQFQNARQLTATLDEILDSTGLSPEYLELELTESSAMQDPDHAISVLRTFLDRGISCAIDDFGTGYSSLSVLRRFPITKLKVDRAFVFDVTTDANNAAIVEAILALAHALNLKVVAEGVETRDHLAFLHNRKCESVQGFLFAKPLPAGDMEALLRDNVRLPLPGELPEDQATG